MQILLPSGKPFRRKEERIKQDDESSTQLREGKAPSKSLPAKHMFRQRREESDVQFTGAAEQDVLCVYMTELRI